jgi:putative FmdB family regulatory protein
MPTYEYQCDACGHEFEREQRITEDPIKTCPSCKARKARRLISRTSFVLKGSGWYSDLYSSNSNANANANDKSEGKGESGGESGTGDSTGADKKEKKAKKGDKKKSSKAAA